LNGPQQFVDLPGPLSPRAFGGGLLKKGKCGGRIAPNVQFVHALKKKIFFACRQADGGGCEVASGEQDQKKETG
jgi:hypothetical protein